MSSPFYLWRCVTSDPPGLPRRRVHLSNAPAPVTRCHMWYGSSEVPCTEIRLLSGDVFTVEGNTDDVERALSDAARSGQSRLAWLRDCDKGHPIGINPTHVITLRPSEISD